jgi:hypothetical protein
MARRRFVVIDALDALELAGAEASAILTPFVLSVQRIDSVLGVELNEAVRFKIAIALVYEPSARGYHVAADAGVRKSLCLEDHVRSCTAIWQGYMALYFVEHIRYRRWRTFDRCFIIP